jgi:hypothetical protein
MNLEDLCHRIDRKMDKDVQSVYQSKNGNAHMTERSHVGTQGRPVKACVVEHGDPSIDEEIEIFEDKKHHDTDFFATNGAMRVSFSVGSVTDVDQDVDIRTIGESIVSVNHSF